MVIETIKQFNFLDILILIALFRICYIAVKMGLPVEFFKLMGVLFATFLSLHYYTKLSDIIQSRFFYKNLPLEFLDFLIFLILAGIGYSIFIILRSIFCRFMKMETVPKINKIGGLILGLTRGYFAIGLFAFMLTISSISYLNRSVESSYLGSKAFAIAPKAYNWLWNNFISKFSPNESSNAHVSEGLNKFGKVNETN
ncbi:MAG: CvpA family protein [Candidatus Omnitrophota bacterium]|nr:CvpA family protein [Candidatus Omnitrophota bacterium]